MGVLGFTIVAGDNDDIIGSSFGFGIKGATYGLGGGGGGILCLPPNNISLADRLVLGSMRSMW